jgi:hypothetical protein
VAIARLKALAGRRDHLIPSDSAPVDHEAGLRAEGPNKLSLSAAIAFTESVDGIDLTQVEAGASGEPFGIGFPQTVLSELPSQQILQRQLNEGSDSKEMAVFRYIHGTDLAGPGIDILKDVFVDRLKVSIVEATH